MRRVSGGAKETVGVCLHGSHLIDPKTNPMYGASDYHSATNDDPFRELRELNFALGPEAELVSASAMSVGGGSVRHGAHFPELPSKTFD